MNGNTYFNLKFYNPLLVQRQQVTSANSKALVTSGVTQRQSRVYFVDYKGILTPILRTWVQKSTLLLQNRGHAEVLIKTPSSAKYVTKVRPPSVPECPPPPPPRAHTQLVEYKRGPLGWLSSIYLFLSWSLSFAQCLGFSSCGW